MVLTPPALILNLALSQLDRAAHTPDPATVQVDDRSLPQLLSLAIDHGKLIRYFEPSGR